MDSASHQNRETTYSFLGSISCSPALTPYKATAPGEMALIGRHLSHRSSVISELTFAEGLRSRKIVTRAQSGTRGMFPSEKMGRMLQWESRHEQNAFILLDCDPDVESIFEQPCKIRFWQDGELRTHYPDILVVRAESKELLEIKSREEAIRPDVAARSALLKTYLPEWGYSYLVLYGDELSSQPRLRNANQLLHFGRYRVSALEHEAMRRHLLAHGSLVWSEACAGTYGPRGRQILCSLTLAGKLIMDRSLPWTPETIFLARAGGI